MIIGTDSKQRYPYDHHYQRSVEQNDLFLSKRSLFSDYPVILEIK